MMPDHPDDENEQGPPKNDPFQRQKAQFDQNAATIADMMVPLWSRIYRTCVQYGFTEGDSMMLLKTYILSQNPHGSRPPQS